MATYSGRLAVAREVSSSRVALRSCSADVAFILGTRYLYLRALRLQTGEVCCKRTRHQCWFFIHSSLLFLPSFHHFCFPCFFLTATCSLVLLRLFLSFLFFLSFSPPSFFPFFLSFSCCDFVFWWILVRKFLPKTETTFDWLCETHSFDPGVEKLT